MAKIAFNKLNINKEIEVNTINFNGVDIKVKQYLDLNSKHHLIDFALESSKHLPYVDRLVSDALFNYLVVISYTDIEITTKREKEDPIKVYDLMENSGLINAVISAINEVEYNSLVEYYEKAITSRDAYATTFRGVMDSFMEKLPMNIESLMSALEGFDPEQLKILNELAAMGEK